VGGKKKTVTGKTRSETDIRVHFLKVGHDVTLIGGTQEEKKTRILIRAFKGSPSPKAARKNAAGSMVGEEREKTVYQRESPEASYKNQKKGKGESSLKSIPGGSAKGEMAKKKKRPREERESMPRKNPAEKKPLSY